jgi:PPOX class probable F420-dependent enzyme
MAIAGDPRMLDLIARNHQGILAAITSAGYPHLTNVLYVWDAERGIARVSTTADRVKGRALRRDPHAALHVSGEHFWQFVVAECDADLSDVAAAPGDDATNELLQVHSAFYGRQLDEESFFRQMIEARRLVVRLRVKRLYGVMLEKPPEG